MGARHELAARGGPHEPALHRQGAGLGRVRGRPELAAPVRSRDRRDHGEAVRAQPVLLGLLAARRRQALHRRRPRHGQQRAQGHDDLGSRHRAPPRAPSTWRTVAGTRPSRRLPTARRSSSPATTSRPTTRRPATRSASSPHGAGGLRPRHEHLQAADRRAGRHAAVPVQFVLPDGRVFDAGPNPPRASSTRRATARSRRAGQPVRRVERGDVRPGQGDEVGHLVGSVVREPDGHRPDRGDRPERARRRSGARRRRWRTRARTRRSRCCPTAA